MMRVMTLIWRLNIFRIYAERNGIAEAIVLLNQALKLDSENHRANVLKRKLIADGSVNQNTGLDTFLQTGMDTNLQ